MTTTQVSESIRSRITKVEGFKTTDNKVHESEAAAVQHQAMLVRQEKLAQFCSTHFYRDIGTDDIAEILEKERAALLTILAGE